MRGTTGRVVDIALSPDLDALLRKLVGDVPKIGRRLICASRGEFAGKPYTYDGISAMLKRAIKKANVERQKQGIEPIPSFGYRDLKGKGASRRSRRVAQRPEESLISYQHRLGFTTAHKARENSPPASAPFP